MYEQEEIEEYEGKTFAKEINALFQTTSAKESTGIKKLFTKIGKKFLNPIYENTGFMTKEEIKKKGNQIKIDKNKSSQKKKKCC